MVTVPRGSSSFFTGLSDPSVSDFSSFAKQSKRFHGEGNGLYPDYWSTNEDLNDSILFVTQDQQMYEILKDVL